MEIEGGGRGTVVKEVLERVMIDWWQLLKEEREAFYGGLSCKIPLLLNTILCSFQVLQ